MANDEHLSLVRQGVKIWNQWRQYNQNQQTQPDLSGADLSGANLRSVNLVGTHLFEADLSSADLRRANISEAHLAKANLSGADLRGSSLIGSNLRAANLSSANLNGANLSDANLNEADLSKTRLRRATLIRVNLSNAKLVNAKLSGSLLIDANLGGANLNATDLSGVNFSGANLSRSDLSGASLIGGNLSRTNLSNANLRNTDFRNTDLRRAVLAGADLIGAILNEAQMGWTALINVDLSQVKGLQLVDHKAPSTIGIDTIYKSAGDIPERFLLGCGLSDIQIKMVELQKQGLTNERTKSLLNDIFDSIVHGAIHSHSSFISYAMKDQQFANRLFADLQRIGVRCWLASEHMPIGGKIREEIHRAISKQEYVVLILSKHALDSYWVEEEVERALALEQERGRKIVLPIRLDDTVLESEKAWAIAVCRRLVGDFRNQRDEQEYKREFDRLLHGLKATAEGGQ